MLGRVVRLRERLGLPLLGCVEDHAAMLHDAGEHAAAEAPYRRALAMAQKAFGAESVDNAAARENLAALLWDAGKAKRRASGGLYWSSWRRSSAARTPTPRRRATTSAGARPSSGAGTARPLLAGAGGARAYFAATTPTSSLSAGSRATSRRSRRAGGTARGRRTIARAREPAVSAPASSAGGAAAMLA